MDQLPNEILFNILQFIPQRYRSNLTAVCKQWNILLLHPLFFNTIHIYSEQQIVKFLNLSKPKYDKNKKINNNTSICHQVKHIHFHSYRITKRKILFYLVKHCPNLKALPGLEVNYPCSIYPDNPFPLINNLQHIYYWYSQYESEEWVSQFLNNQHQLKTLELYLNKPCFQLNRHHSSSTSISSTPTSSVSLSSLTTFIYFTPVGSLQQHSSILEESTSILSLSEYRIHLLKLPSLISLTRLSLYVYKNADERMMEMIHQSCPQLISLQFTYLKMHLSEQYIKTIESNRPLSSFLKPHSSMKELYISNQLYDPRCYDYLSFKYPHLESLSLDIGIRYCSNEFIPSFKTSIYHMITSYIDLNHLKVKLGNGNFATQVWPHSEILYWLNKNPTQLTHLDYEYDCSKRILKEDISNDYNHLNQQQIYYNMIPSPPPSSTSSTPSISTSLKKNKEPIPFFQYHHYLNHLSSLTLYKSIQHLNDVFCGFFLHKSNVDKGNSIIVSHSIQELNLEVMDCRIYFWLDIFPNLKSLKIKYANLVKGELDDNNNNTIEKENQEIYSSIRLKMEQNKQRRYQQILDFNRNKTSTFHTTMNHLHYYSLKKIEMESCAGVRLEWNDFFKFCPHLKSIILKKINHVCKATYVQDEIRPVQQFTFDLSHLSLDHLEIYRFNDAPYSYVRSFTHHFVKELMIHETSLDKTYFVGPNNLIQSTLFHYTYSTTLNIICKSIDCLIFDAIDNDHNYG